MFKKCQVVMLPTNEKANIIKHDLGHIFYSKEALNKETVSMLSNQHLYFLSDEEIKKLPK